MEILIFGLILGVGIISTVALALSAFVIRHTETISLNKSQALIERLIAVMDDESLSVDDRQEVYKKVVSDMRKHLDTGFLVAELPEELPDNVRVIKRYKKAV